MSAPTLSPDASGEELGDTELLELSKYGVQVATACGVSREVAEDVAQEAIIKLLREGSSAVNSPRAWLRVVVRNEVNRLWRRSPIVEEFVEIGENPWHWTDTRIEVRQILSELPSRERAVLSLAGAGYSQSEIARRLTCSVKVVEKLLHRGRSRGRSLREAE